MVGNQGFQRMDLQFGKCPSNDGISDPLSYKFEIGRGKGTNRKWWGMRKFEIFETGPRRGEGEELFGRPFARFHSRWKNFNWAFTVGEENWISSLVAGPHYPWAASSVAVDATE